MRDSMVGTWIRAQWQGWTKFWFQPSDPATLGVIRICTGWMLFYTHLVWTLDFQDFFGPRAAWLDLDTAALIQGDGWAWSHFWVVQSPAMLMLIHVASLAVFLLLMVGLWTRVTSVVALLIAISYVHRVPGALFGLDQINTLLALYVAIGPSGAAFSVDAWRTKRRNGHQADTTRPRVGTTVAIRLLQIHMCIVYLFAGMAKLQGQTWWNGTALWGAIANLEYQTVDLTWLVHSPTFVAFLTHLTVFWELFYIALVWPRATRPFVLAVAVLVHVGIGICLGMMTFGFAMLIGNMAFVTPEFVRRVLPGQGRGDGQQLPAQFASDNAKPAAKPHTRRTSKGRGGQGGQNRSARMHSTSV